MTRLPFDPAVDYYRVLGVKPNATAEEIHATYRRLARHITQTVTLARQGPWCAWHA